jgi:cytochrome c-type biogenesis protein CcmH/NrfF
MFLIWALPLLLLLIVVVWVVFWSMRGRVHHGERKQGRVLKDD